LVTFYPTLVRLGVSKKAAAAMIGTTAVLDLGPASGATNLAAKTAGLDVAVYFASYQVPVAVLTIITISVLTFITAKYFDKKEGHLPQNMESQTSAGEEKELETPPAIYALLPVLPLTLILIFSKLMISSIKLNVVTAMLIGMLVGMMFELVRTRDMQKVFKGLLAFFDGMGHMFARIVTLIVCAETFAAGLKTIGAVNFLTTTAQNAGFELIMMTLVMCLIVSVVAILTGSGNAAFFSFGHLAPDMAAKFGSDAVSMLLPMQLTAGLARSMSPVAGVIIAVSDAGECTPFDIIKRTAIPVAGGILVTVLQSVIFA
jgi:DcuC family C4-dicarboxylate transporter